MERYVKEDTDWLSLLRGLNFVFIMFCHFEYQAFDYAYGTCIQAQWQRGEGFLQTLLLGLWGKYFFAMMCLVSGAVTAIQVVQGKAGKPLQFMVKRYIRMQLPAFVMGLVFILTDLLTYRRYTWSMILRGLFVLGSKVFDDHLFALIDFYIGGLVVYLVFYFLPDKRKLRVLILSLIGLGGFLWLGGQNREEMWIFPTILGGVLYEILQFIGRWEEDHGRMLTADSAKTEWNKKRLLWLIFFIPVVFFRRGHESYIMYWRDTLCWLVTMPVMRLTGFHLILNRIYKRPWVKGIDRMGFSIFCVHGWINTYIVATLMRLYRAELPGNLVFPYIVGFMTLIVLTNWGARFMYRYVEQGLYKKIIGKLYPKNNQI